jgi:HEAT repeat protein
MNTTANPWLILLGIILFGGNLAAHGSVYPPPPTFYDGPVDTAGQRPSGKKPPSGSGPAGPSRPIPRAPTTPGSPITPVPLGANPGTMPGSGGDPFQDSGSWEFWWEFNKEPFLELRRHLDQRSVVTGVDGYYLGRGADRFARRLEGRVDRERVRGEILPALLETLRESDSNDLTTGCLVALAKIAAFEKEALRGTVEQALRSHLADSNQEIAETATASLGILGRESSALLLGEIARDSTIGRQAVGRTRVPVRTRTFAVYALGLLAHRSANEDVRRFVIHELAQVLERDDGATRDLPTACVLSIGRVPLAWARPGEGEASRRPVVASCREAQVRALLSIFKDGDADHYLRSHAASSLGILLSGETDESHASTIDEVLDALVAALRNGVRTPPEIRQSCAIALGLLGDADEEERDAEIRKVLSRAVTDDRDRVVRNFAMIALARVAARPGRGPDPEAVAEVRRLLLRQLSRGSTAARDWAALALGMQERFRIAAGAMPDPSAGEALRLALGDARSSSAIGALSVANGVLGDVEAAELLRGVLIGGGEDRVRGLAAVALGLVEARGEIGLLRKQALEATRRPDLLRELACALGLLRDHEAAGFLVEAFEKTSSLSSRVAIARALGRVGDSESITPLISLMQSDERSGIARALAAVALGSLADEDPLPWNAILSVDTNYTLIPPTLYDSQGFGILNIL